MAKVKKKKKKKLGARSMGASKAEVSTLRPKFVEKTPPCIHNCPNHNKIRDAVMTISKAEDYGKDYDQAIEEAWHLFMETTPFPSVCGRVCPHPCEGECNRKDVESGLAVNNMERFIGDFGLEKKLVPKKLTEEKREEKIAVVGSGPGGLSCAYQLARRGYPVTVYEAFPKSGGMLRYGIPPYRLPHDILDAEVERIVSMGVEIKYNTMVGKDVPYDELKKECRAIFVALGAQQGISLRVEGEDAENVFTGTDFLHRANSGEAIDVGDNVVVIGGGDTAIDAARVSRRLGANATILYRRTKQEMPAIDEEIVGAEQEGVKIEFLAAPLEIYKEGNRAIGMKCQRMELGEPDASGRRRPVPIEGDTFDLQFSTLIAAISQKPDFTGVEELIEGKNWIKVDEQGKTKVDNMYSGGDNVNLGLVINAIYDGRRAAEAIHEMITGEPIPQEPQQQIVRSEKMSLSYYDKKDRSTVKELPVEERFATQNAEITSTLTREEAITEAKRCLSCGRCFDCGTCWSYCQEGGIHKPLVKGEPYRLDLSICVGCKKCAESCPCGYIDMC